MIMNSDKMCIIDKERLGAETRSELIPDSGERKKPDSSPTMVTIISQLLCALYALKLNFDKVLLTIFPRIDISNSHKPG